MPFDTHDKSPTLDAQAENPQDVDQAIESLYRQADELGRQCLFTRPNGGLALGAFPGDDEPLPLRDLAIVVEGCPELLPINSLKDICREYVHHQLPDGTFPHGLQADGTAYYRQDGKPDGPPSLSGDNLQAMIALAWQAVQLGQDADFTATIVPALGKGVRALPRNERTQLVACDGQVDEDTCPCSFAPGVRQRGDLLICSLLLVQALQQLADIFQHLGRDGDSDMWRAEAQLVAKRVRMYFWDKDPGLFRAATKVANEPDIWGSVLSVYLNVATSGQLVAIARYCREQVEAIVRHGCLRGLPAGQYWSACTTPRGEFENGGFWPGASGWLAYTVDILDAASADRIIIDLATHFANDGIFKAIGESGVGRFRDYLPSIAMPLAGIQKMMARRRKRAEQAVMQADF